MTQSRSPFDFLAARFPGVDQSNSWATTIELRAKLSAATSAAAVAVRKSRPAAPVRALNWASLLPRCTQSEDASSGGEKSSLGGSLLLHSNIQLG